MAWEKLEATFWKPSIEKDEIIGKVLGVTETQYGEAIQIETEDNSRILVNYTALNERLKELIDKKVKIVYTGEAKGKSGRTYKNFDIYVER